MSKIYSLVLILLIMAIAPTAFADDGGNNPGYVSTPVSGDNSLVRSGYGSCFHTGYWKADYGQDQCGEGTATAAKEITKKITFSESNTQLFKFNVAILSDHGKKQILEMLNQVKESGYIDNISVKGYADMIGGSDYNLRLSNDRASAVKDFIVDQGIDSDAVTATGFGLQNSLVSQGCFEKYGTDGLAEINLATANEKNMTASERQAMDQALANFAANHKTLVHCTAPDRRVEITINLSKQIIITQ